MKNKIEGQACQTSQRVEYLTCLERQAFFLLLIAFFIALTFIFISIIILDFPRFSAEIYTGNQGWLRFFVRYFVFAKILLFRPITSVRIVAWAEG